MKGLARILSLSFIFLSFGFIGYYCVSFAYADLPWEQVQKLRASDGSALDLFGSSVALQGNIAVVGSDNDDDNNHSGSAYVFDVTTGEQFFKLLPSDGSDGDRFGVSVAVDGQSAVIGANQPMFTGSNFGRAYVFDITTGQQLHELFAPDRIAGDQFGTSVSLSGNDIVIGMPGDDDQGSSSGSSYVFDVRTGDELNKILPLNGTSDDQFGTAVALSGNLAVIGSPYDTGIVRKSGTAYVFRKRTTNLLMVSPEPLISGLGVVFNLIQTLPNESSWLLYSVNGLGNTFISQLNVTIQLANPKVVFGPEMTDANGDLRVVRQAPKVMNPLNIWFQAVQLENSTNVVATKIVP